MKEDLSIVKLNISSLKKPSFRRLNTQRHSKIAHPYITYNMQNRYLHNSFDAKIVGNSICVYKSSHPVHFSAGNIDMLSAEGFFYLQKRKGQLQNIFDKKVSALARLTFYENLMIGQATSIRCPR